MKRRIDFLKKDIKQNKFVFIAILLITALSVGFLTGLISIAPDMEYTADKYYDDRNFWDLKINSTLGFTEEDMEAIKKQDYVEAASGVISLEVSSSLGSKGDYNTLLYAVDFDNDVTSDEMLSAPVLIEGSYPINNKSCVVLKSAALKNDVKIGDKIYLNSGGNILSEVAFTVTGIADAPEFASTQKQSGTSSDKNIEMVVYVSKQVYPAYSIYTDVYIKVKGTEKLNAFSGEYSKAISSASKKLTALSKEREKLRDESITGQHQALLGQATNDYKKHEADIRTQLAAQKKYVNSLEKSIKKSEEDIANLTGQLATQKANLDIQAPTIAALKALGNTATAEQKATIKRYDDALKNHNNSVADLDKKVSALNIDKSIYEQAKKSYDKNLKQANKELANAQNKLEGYKDQKQESGKQSWFINDRTSNASFMSVKSDTQKIRAMSKTVPVIFVLIAVALIILFIFYYNSCRQNENGVLRAMGYSSKLLIKKNTLFTVWAVGIGALIGIVLGVLILPLASYEIFDNINNYGPIRILFVPSVAILSVVIFIGISVAAYYVCKYFTSGKTSDLIKAQSNLLTQTKVPLKIESVLVSFKPSLKNPLMHILKNRKRFCINLLGVACCVVLFLTATGIRSAINSTLELQYNDIQHYDADIYVKSGVDIQKADAFKKVLIDKKYVEKSLAVRREIFTVQKDNAKITVLVLPQKSNIESFISLKTSKRKPIEIGKNSVIIGKNFAKANGVKAGDTLKLVTHSGAIKNFKVSAVTENYIGNTVYISNDAYKAVMGEDFTVNSYLIKLAAGADKRAFERSIKNTGIISDVTYPSNSAEDTEIQLKSFGDITVLITLCSCLLIILVVYMLTHINVALQKDRLAYTMLNGATKEYKVELCAEIVTTLLIGLILGVGIAWGIASLTLAMLSGADIMFIKNINFGITLARGTLVLSLIAAITCLRFVFFRNSLIRK